MTQNRNDTADIHMLVVKSEGSLEINWTWVHIKQTLQF